MATTTTPNLGLIKPQSGTGEPISDWPDQHKSNMEALEEALHLDFGEYSLEMTTFNSPFTVDLGSSEVVAKWIRIGPALVRVWLNVEFASDIDFSSGAIFATVPWEIDSTFHDLHSNTAEGSSLGKAYFRDSVSPEHSHVMNVQAKDSDSVAFPLIRTEVGLWRDGDPDTINDEDVLTAQFQYLTNGTAVET